RLHRVLRRTGLPAAACAVTAVRVSGRSVLSTGSGLGGAGTVTTLPLLLVALAPRRTRAVAVVTVLAPPLLELLARRPALGPATWTALRLVDDLAYASGVWRGCWTARTTAPLRPRRSRPR
ncbi:MAG: mftF, partial [Frankiales bacterium]|nr:mftF [Frankiales bacterium]